MDRFLDEDNTVPSRDQSSSPIVNNLIYADPKRQQSPSHSTPHDTPSKDAASQEGEPANSAELAVALEMMQKVVDPSVVFSPIKTSTVSSTTNTDITTALPTTLCVTPKNNIETVGKTETKSSTTSVTKKHVDNNLPCPATKRLKVDPDRTSEQADISKSTSVKSLTTAFSTSNNHVPSTHSTTPPLNTSIINSSTVPLASADPIAQ